VVKMRSQAESGGVAGCACLIVLLAALAWSVARADTSTEIGQTPKTTVTHQAPPHPARQTLDDRVRMYTRELNLDAAQQSQLRQVLESQRDQVSRLWNDTTVPAANRVIETRAIMDKSADRIRAFLNEEQRKKYNPPRQPHPTRPEAGERGVEDWMEASRQKTPSP